MNISLQWNVPELYLPERHYLLPWGYLGTMQLVYKALVFKQATFICFSKALTLDSSPPSTARKPWWEVRNLAMLLRNIIMIKAHKWLYSALSLTALPTIAHACSMQWTLSCLRRQLPTAIWLLLSDQMGSFASLFVSVKWKRQQKDSLLSRPSLQSSPDLLWQNCFTRCNETKMFCKAYELEKEIHCHQEAMACLVYEKLVSVAIKKKRLVAQYSF